MEIVNLHGLAGRIEALQLLYRDLRTEGLGQAVDLGHYVSEIASAVMHTYAVDGIRLDIKVDHAPVRDWDVVKEESEFLGLDCQSGADLKPPQAAAVKSRGSERCGNVGERKRSPSRLEPLAASPFTPSA
jgi:hypothetical protein